MTGMLHTVGTLSIRKYSEIDRTGDLSILKRWYNPFPVKWFNTEKFFEEFSTIFSHNKDKTLLNERYRILAFYKLIALDRILKTLLILMDNSNERSLFSELFKRKPKDANLDFYTEKVKKMAGIEIKKGEDLERLKNEIQRLLDKYNERYNKKEKSQPKASFMEVVLGVFSVMDMDYVPEMTLAEFGKLRELADKKIKDGRHK